MANSKYSLLKINVCGGGARRGGAGRGLTGSLYLTSFARSLDSEYRGAELSVLACAPHLVTVETPSCLKPRACEACRGRVEARRKSSPSTHLTFTFTTKIMDDPRFNTKGKRKKARVEILTKPHAKEGNYLEKVDARKVNLPIVNMWIEKKLNALLGFEDEVLVGMVQNQLEEGSESGNKLDAADLEITLTGFLEENAPIFVCELWQLLTDAQKQKSGVPTKILEEKKAELRKARERGHDGCDSGRGNRGLREEDRGRRGEQGGYRSRDRRDESQGRRDDRRDYRRDDRRDHRRDDRRDYTGRNRGSRDRDHAPRDRSDGGRGRENGGRPGPKMLGKPMEPRGIDNRPAWMSDERATANDGTKSSTAAESAVATNKDVASDLLAQARKKAMAAAAAAATTTVAPEAPAEADVKPSRSGKSRWGNAREQSSDTKTSFGSAVPAITAAVVTAAPVAPVPSAARVSVSVAKAVDATAAAPGLSEDGERVNKQKREGKERKEKKDKKHKKKHKKEKKEKKEKKSKKRKREDGEGGGSSRAIAAPKAPGADAARRRINNVQAMISSMGMSRSGK